MHSIGMEAPPVWIDEKSTNPVPLPADCVFSGLSEHYERSPSLAQPEFQKRCMCRMQSRATTGHPKHHASAVLPQARSPGTRVCDECQFRHSFAKENATQVLARRHPRIARFRAGPQRSMPVIVGFTTKSRRTRQGVDFELRAKPCFKKRFQGSSLRGRILPSHVIGDRRQPQMFPSRKASRTLTTRQTSCGDTMQTLFSRLFIEKPPLYLGTENWSTDNAVVLALIKAALRSLKRTSQISLLGRPFH